MGRSKHISGAALPTALVVCTLLALLVSGVALLWEADHWFFSRRQHRAASLRHTASGFTLYAEHPDRVASELDGDGTLLLYEGIESSRIGITRSPHGLYEKVTIETPDGMKTSKLLGRRVPGDGEFTLLYVDGGRSISLAGKTNLTGRLQIPASGVVYGRVGPDFFSGQALSPSMVGVSGSEIPAPEAEALARVRQLAASATEDIIIRGTLSRDTVMVGRKVKIEDGFSGSLQVFASDSIVLGRGVTLDYPSGLFSETYVGIGDDCTVNGYVVVVDGAGGAGGVDGAGGGREPDPLRAEYSQSRLSRVRGLVYVDGTAQFQGIITGVAIFRRTAYYSPAGYYENMIYDGTVLENHEMAWPLWLDGPPQRKEARWGAR